MRAWLLMLGPFLIWALHFGGVYAIASVFAVIDRADAAASRLAAGGFTLACLVADLLVAAVIARDLRTGGGGEARAWMLSLGGLAAGLTFVSVLWQGLPALVGH